MRRRMYIFVALLIVLGVVVRPSPFTVYATEENNLNPTVVLEHNNNITEKNGINNLVKEINTKLQNGSKVSYAGDFVVIKSSTADSSSVTFDMLNYKKLSQEKKQFIMQTTLECIKNSNCQVSTISRNKMYNFLAREDESTSNLVRQLSTDTRADFAAGYIWLKPFNGAVGVLLGVIALGMFMLLAITIVLDVAYINLPFFQYLMLQSAEYNKSDKHKIKIPKIVSVEAYHAVQQAEDSAGSNNYKNPMTCYFALKTKQLIMLFILLLYLVSGRIFELIAWFMDFFSGIIG